MQIQLTEQCGARWIARKTMFEGERAYWIMWAGGQSQAKPGIVGFYAQTIEAAAEALAN